MCFGSVFFLYGFGSADPYCEKTYSDLFIHSSQTLSDFWFFQVFQVCLMRNKGLAFLGKINCFLKLGSLIISCSFLPFSSIIPLLIRDLLGISGVHIFLFNPPPPQKKMAKYDVGEKI